MIDNHPNSELDVTELLCPLPVLRARKKLNAMAPGQILKVIATDPMSVVDMPHFCTEQGHDLVSHETTGRYHVFIIQRSSNPAAPIDHSSE
jgi:tRNA 2-thiouridine synthesizing protein A